MATHRDQCQVVTYAPGFKDCRYLGRIGHVGGLTYDFTLPGGASTMSSLLQVPPGKRNPALNAGRICHIQKGLSVVWDGNLAESIPTKDGWQVTGVGIGAQGADFMGYFATWNLDDPVNQAITRGLRWRHPTAFPSGWLLATPDNASFSITDHMTNITSKQGLTWSVARDGTVSVLPIPTTPNRLLISTDPVPRTAYGNLTTVWLKYTTADDGQGNTTFAYTDYANQAAINQFNPHEIYEDLTSAVVSPAVMSSLAAQTAGQNMLAMYTRAAWGGPFTVAPGQLLTMGGTPTDLATEQAGTVCRLMVTDAPFGGEIVAGAIQFPVGQYVYDEDSQTASITPMQSYRSDLGTVLSNFTQS